MAFVSVACLSLYAVFPFPPQPLLLVYLFDLKF
jgi:hypothetical protein